MANNKTIINEAIDVNQIFSNSNSAIPDNKPMSNSFQLLEACVNVISGVLIHQRSRWFNITNHERQFEGWWKAEFVTALESWTYSIGLPSFGVLPEAKPRRFGLTTSKQSADILIAPWDNQTANFSSNTPRLWIDIKERGTWWPNARKAFGMHNQGLRHDLAKWSSTNWSEGDIVMCAHILLNDGPLEVPVPEDWLAELTSISREYELYKSFTISHPRNEAESNHRFARLDFFIVHPDRNQLYSNE
jgi:hypothetical protein